MSEPKKVAGKLLLDMPEGRYDLVKLVRDWTAVLQRSDETKGMNNSEIIKKAMEDVISGRVTEDDIKKAKAKNKAAPEPEPVVEAPKVEEEEKKPASKPKKHEKGKK